MDMQKILRRIKLYSILLVGSIIFYFFVIPNQIYMSSGAKAEDFSPDTFPNALTMLLIFTSLAGLIGAIFQYRKMVVEHGKIKIEKTKLTKTRVIELAIPFVVLVLILVYVVLFRLIGFIPATAIIPPLVLFIIGGRKWQHYLIYYIFAAVMYVLFKYILLVPIH